MSDNRLREDPRPEEWSKWQGAVLLRNQIKYYCRLDPPLIYPFYDDDDHLKPASYHLSLGRHCRVSGIDQYLSDKESLIIQPHCLAIVSTLERVSIPGFLIGRWNLRVKKVYEGLVWVGGAQVDPGYEGHLFCPLYNLSTKPVEIKYGDGLFTIDFVRTTRFDALDGCTLLKLDRATDSFAQLDEKRLQSAPEAAFKKFSGELEEARGKMGRDLKVGIEGFQNRIDTFQSIIFTILGIIVAALAFVGLSGLLPWEGDLHWWQITTCVVTLLSIAVLAVVLALATVKTVLCGRTKQSSDSQKEGDK